MMPAALNSTLAALLFCGPALSAQDVPDLRATVLKIVGEYQGVVGVAVHHIESGRGFSINGHRRFPLASIYKLPMMVEAFRQAATGRFALSDRLTIGPESYHPWGTIMSQFEMGLQPTVRDVLFWMIVETDNLATDLILAQVGADSVRATLHRLGLDEISVDRPAKNLILDYFGFSADRYYQMKGPALDELSERIGRMLTDQLEAARLHRPLPERVLQYDRDPRDSGSPVQINQLFVRIFNGEVVSPAASAEMLKILLQTRTGDVGWIAGAKLKGLLPPGTPVAHKTGDWPTSNNDAGIIYLPDGKGHLAVTVLDTDMNEDFPASAKMIARVARAAYDFFVR